MVLLVRIKLSRVLYMLFSNCGLCQSLVLCHLVQLSNKICKLNFNSVAVQLSNLFDLTYTRHILLISFRHKHKCILIIRLLLTSRFWSMQPLTFLDEFRTFAEFLMTVNCSDSISNDRVIVLTFFFFYCSELNEWTFENFHFSQHCFQFWTCH